MRKKHKEITDLAEVERLLHQTDVCHLALMDADSPYVVPMHFGYADGRLYMHSAPAGRKIELLKACDRVAFSLVAGHVVTIGTPACRSDTVYLSVAGRGRARILTELEDKRRGLTLLMADFSAAPAAFDDADLARVVVIEVLIEEMHGKKHPAPKPED